MSSVFSRLVGLVLILLFLAGFCCAEEGSYRIVDDGGYVAVVEEQSGEIWRTEICVSGLPQADWVLLEQGIVCSDRTALAAALENFDF